MFAIDFCTIDGIWSVHSRLLKCLYTGRHSRGSNKWIDIKTMKDEENKEEHRGPDYWTKDNRPY